MEKEVNGIELLQLIHDNKINKKEKIYSATFDEEFYWSGKNLKNEEYEYLNKYKNANYNTDAIWNDLNNGLLPDANWEYTPEKGFRGINNIHP